MNLQQLIKQVGLGVLCLLASTLTAQQSIEWRDMVGCSQNGDTLIRSADAAAWGTYHGRSRATWKRSETHWFELTLLELGKQYSIGLTYTDIEYDYRFFAHSVFIDNTTLKVYHRGDQKYSANALVVGDKIKVQLSNGTLTYFLNGSQVYTSTAIDEEYWYVATDFFTPDTRVLVQQSTDTALGAYVKVTADKTSSYGAGAINIEAFGGTPPFSYSWKKNGAAYSTDEDLTSLYPGEYELTVTDNSSSTYTRKVNVYYEAEYAESTSGISNDGARLKNTTGQNEYAVLTQVLPKGEDGEIILHQGVEMADFMLGFSELGHNDGCENFRTGINYSSSVNDISGGCTVNLYGSYSWHRGMCHKLVREGDEVKIYYDGVFKKSIDLPSDRDWYIKLKTKTQGPLAYIFSRFGDAFQARADISHNRPTAVDNHNGSIELHSYGGVSPSYSWKKDGVVLSETSSSLIDIAPGVYEVTMTSGSQTQVNTYTILNQLDWRAKSGFVKGGDTRLKSNQTSAESNVAVQYLPANQDGYVDFYSTSDLRSSNGTLWRLGMSFLSNDRGCGSFGRGLEVGGSYAYRYNGCQAHNISDGAHLGKQYRISRQNQKLYLIENGSDTIVVYDQDTAAAMYVHTYMDQGPTRTGYIYSSFGHELNASATVTHCDNQNEQGGVIDLHPYGGNPPYSFQWKKDGVNYSTSEDLNDLKCGTYEVTISDAQGSQTVSFEILNYMDWVDLNGMENIGKGLVKKTSSESTYNSGKAANRYELLPYQNGHIDIHYDQNKCEYFRLAINTVKSNYQNEHTRAGLDFGVNGDIVKPFTNGKAELYKNWELESGFFYRIERNGDQLHYYKNGVLKHSCDYPPDDPVQVYAYALYKDTETPTILANFGSELGHKAEVNHYRPSQGQKGSIIATVFGGDGNYTYAWEENGVARSETGAILEDLMPGDYKLTVTDGAGGSYQRTYKVLNHVIWKKKNEADASAGGTIYKTGANGWNEGQLTSLTYLPAGEDGSLYIRVNTSIVSGMIGLSEKPLHEGYATITNAFYLTANATSHFYEKGLYYPASLAYSNGDLLEIRRTGTTLDYLKNGTVVRTKTVTNDQPLYVEAHLHYQDYTLCDVYTSFGHQLFYDYNVQQANAGIAQAASISVTPYGGQPGYSVNWDGGIQGEQLSWIESGTYSMTLTDAQSSSVTATLDVPYMVDWENINGLSFDSEGRCTKTATSGWTNGYADSKNILEFGNDGYVEFTVTDPGQRIMIALHPIGTSHGYLNLRHSFYYGGNGKTYVYENGGNWSGIGYPAGGGDVMRVSKEGDSIFYYLNGVEKRQMLAEDSVDFEIVTYINAQSTTFPAGFAHTSFGLPASQAPAPLPGGSYNSVGYFQTNRLMNHPYVDVFNELNVVYKNNEIKAGEQLTYRIIDQSSLQQISSGNIEATGSYNKITLDGSTEGFGLGLYLLELTDAKGDQQYLKFNNRQTSGQ